MKPSELSFSSEVVDLALVGSFPKMYLGSGHLFTPWLPGLGVAKGGLEPGTCRLGKAGQLLPWQQEPLEGPGVHGA